MITTLMVIVLVRAGLMPAYCSEKIDRESARVSPTRLVHDRARMKLYSVLVMQCGTQQNGLQEETASHTCERLRRFQQAQLWAQPGPGHRGRQPPVHCMPAANLAEGGQQHPPPHPHRTCSAPARKTVLKSLPIQWQRDLLLHLQLWLAISIFNDSVAKSLCCNAWPSLCSTKQGFYCFKSSQHSGKSAWRFELPACHMQLS